MRNLLRAVFGIIFPRAGSVRQVSYKYLTLLILLPVLAGVAFYLADIAGFLHIRDTAVIAASFGVLGGLLFAHAIFVFQLRVNYDASEVEPGPPEDAKQRDLRVRPLIDEMFSGVLYASLVALILTVVTSSLAAVLDVGACLPPALAAVIVTLGAHLTGAVYHVISATTTAYNVLKSQPR